MFAKHLARYANPLTNVIEPERRQEVRQASDANRAISNDSSRTIAAPKMLGIALRKPDSISLAGWEIDCMASASRAAIATGMISNVNTSTPANREIPVWPVTFASPYFSAQRSACAGLEHARQSALCNTRNGPANTEDQAGTDKIWQKR